MRNWTSGRTRMFDRRRPRCRKIRRIPTCTRGCWSGVMPWPKNSIERCTKSCQPRSLQELVRLMPKDRASLKKIPGIGKGKLKRFGTDLLGIVGKYYAEKEMAPKPQEPSKANTKQVSFDLYKSGKTIAEIAAERKLT